MGIYMGISNYMQLVTTSNPKWTQNKRWWIRRIALCRCIVLAPTTWMKLRTLTPPKDAAACRLGKPPRCIKISEYFHYQVTTIHCLFVLKLSWKSVKTTCQIRSFLPKRWYYWYALMITMIPMMPTILTIMTTSVTIVDIALVFDVGDGDDSSGTEKSWD